MTQAMRNSYHQLHLLEMAKNGLMLEEFLVKKANIDVRDEEGRSIFYWAIKKRSKHNVQLLMKYNAALMVKEELHALFHAISSNDIETFILLLEEKLLNIDMQNHLGQTLLMKAIEKESVQMVRYLINHGAHLYLEDEENKKAIDYAKETKDKRVYELVYYRILFEQLEGK